MSNLQIPIACTISADDAAAQALGWSELGRNLLSTEHLGDGVALTFPADMAESVRNLATREAECCSFLSVTTDMNELGVQLIITSDNPDHRPVIEGLAGMIAGR